MFFDIIGATYCNTYFSKYVGGEQGLTTLNDGDSLICYLTNQNLYSGRGGLAREFMFHCLTSMSTEKANTLNTYYRSGATSALRRWPGTIYTADGTIIPKKDAMTIDGFSFFDNLNNYVTREGVRLGQTVFSYHEPNRDEGASLRQFKMATGWTTFTLPPLSDPEYTGKSIVW
jgi:hypothetical protein